MVVWEGNGEREEVSSNLGKIEGFGVFANVWCCRFNAIAFYLDIADMLSKEGL